MNSSEALYVGINKLWDAEPKKFVLSINVIEGPDSKWIKILKLSESIYYFKVEKNGRFVKDNRLPEKLLQRLVDDIYDKYSQNIQIITFMNLDNHRFEYLYDINRRRRIDVGVNRRLKTKRRKRSKNSKSRRKLSKSRRINRRS